MKKIFAILVAVCMLAGALCITAFAADPVVLRVQALKSGEADPILIGDYTSFEDGWNKAMELAGKLRKNGYDRVVVDLFASWTAKNGAFADDSDGFDNETLYIPEGAKVTINMNNHTINRAMTDWEWNGEVLYVDENADVIICDGTITGGWSGNGAGGIHVMDDAKVMLNRVHVDGNKADDDDGAGIALYDGATLIMNGGSLNNNQLIGTNAGGTCGGGGIYAEGSTVILDGVEIKNNQTFNDFAAGIAIYADESEVTLSNCTIDGNGIETDAEGSDPAFSAIHLDDSNLTVTKSKFINNGTYFLSAGIKYLGGSSIVRMYDASSVNFEDCIFENNTVAQLFQSNGIEEGAVFYATNCTAVNNNAAVYWGDATSVFKACTFNNNKPKNNVSVFENESGDLVSLIDCSMGDTTYLNEGLIDFEFSDVLKEDAVLGVSVIFGGGSTEFSQYYKTFESGWQAVLDHAVADSGYDRIIVDLYADWNVKGGFMVGAVEIPENAKVTINMNGHTIDANLTDDIINGEVLYIGVGADVVINDGTITGGYSNNGAGGIHIKENATVVLNNVNVDKNATDGSRGAGIAVYDGANLTMNGGSISQNEIYGFFPYGILYVNEATATLNGVTISGNKGCNGAEGVAIYADESTVTLNNCVVSDNDTDLYSESIIGAVDSKLIINNTDFINNGAVSDTMDFDYSHLFYLDDCDLTMTGGTITGNKADILFYIYCTMADIRGVTVTDNESVSFQVINPTNKATLTECTLGSNSPVKYEEDVFVEVKGSVEFKNCELGDTTFANADNVVGLDAGVASIMGEGSFTTILLLLSLASSFAAMALTIANNKKKGALATGAEDEE
ncbi:MAG: right-handed parallel beta-helix repeat-containing protein [Clostridia bacterium]|nr:right-handed parallel beta-helix repeat-containing protein [Clostridia bacterium]